MTRSRKKVQMHQWIVIGYWLWSNLRVCSKCGMLMPVHAAVSRPECTGTSTALAGC